MRDRFLWGAAVAFLLTAFYTVHVRREVNQLGREIGAMEIALLERVRFADNLHLELEQLASPGSLSERAEEAGAAISGKDRR